MDRRIDELQHDEGELYIYLSPGYSIEREPDVFAHCFGAYDRKELKLEMSKVTKCRCADCTAIEKEQL